MLLNTGSSRAFLSEELARRLKLNPRYSQRAFARQLGLSAGELSELLRGKRDLSLKSALRIARSLGLNPAETRHLLYLAQLEKSLEHGGEQILAPTLEDKQRQQLTLDMFHVVSDWFCFAILNLAETDGFRFDSTWIGRRLGISIAEARTALERLERVGLIERHHGRLALTPDYVVSPSGIPSEAIRSYHRQVLKRASDALETQAVADRDITGIGFAAHPRHVEAIKREIAEFQDQLIARYSKGRKTEVFHLEVALFRMTTSEGDLKP